MLVNKILSIKAVTIELRLYAHILSQNDIRSLEYSFDL